MSVIARSDQGEPMPPALTFTTPEALKAASERGSGMVGAPVLPGPSNGVHLHPHCPDCDAD